MRLLIIEDDTRVTWLLERGLKSQYAIDSVGSGKAGLSQAHRRDYDAIILDLHLPDITGLEVCRQLRRRGQSTPILVLTGRPDLGSVTELLNSGADDYLTKPFNIEEVGARLRAILRRSFAAQSSNRLMVGDLELDLDGYTVRRQGQVLMLSRKDFSLLEYLMHNPCRTLTRTMILAHVWGADDVSGTNVVDVHMKQLRDIVDKPFPEKLIKTVYGIGYRLESKTAIEPATFI